MDAVDKIVMVVLLAGIVVVTCALAAAIRTAL